MVDRINDEKVKISPKANRILNQLLEENTRLKEILLLPEQETIKELKKWAEEELKQNSLAYKYYKGEIKGRKTYEKLKWKDFASIRILDYIHNANLEYEDLNLRGKKDISNPFHILWLAANHGTGGGKYLFFLDMLELFRQFNGKNKLTKPNIDKIHEWMDRHPSGLDPEIIKARKENKQRILKIILDMIDSGEMKSSRFSFDSEMTYEEKMEKMNEWWNSKLFHLKFAVRKPDLLNKMLDYSLDPETMQTLYAAQETGIPFFVNPYYLSLLDTKDRTNADLAIRDYIIYSQELVDEFGHIVAWEKEDIVEPGKPNAAGWLLPSDHNIHRRYPEVAILIPDSMGRACGGLCSSCQRMYDFQRGNLNFNLDQLKPNETWSKKLIRLLKYFEEDTQLRDILITGGDALMSSDKSLKRILDAVYDMALNKKKNNKYLKEGEKHAEILRVRLGTRLPVYLPQRITDELAEILSEFKQKASQIGIKQFVIQTHFESAMEITPDTVEGLKKLISAGWTITNQMVFTTAGSRRGHTAKLRKVLNDVGVLTYYTFSVKGYMENYHNFATNARAVQEQLEEKRLGVIPKEYNELVHTFPENAENMIENINSLREKANIPFLATDRNVLNLPGVGKSLTFRTIGITRQGRRILEFDHDANRRHSPIIDQMGKVVIVESKPIGEYLGQIEEMGEDINEYQNLWGYSIGETEERMPIYIYPDYDFRITEEFTNLELQE
ncbi:MAG: lysine 2,3-aminomutase [Bacteroidales bacterium]|nr:lysine 2,3-aminomutase [Bacteroidales bacterium]